MVGIISFASNDVPQGITQNGSAPTDYGAGQNDVNVTNIKIYDGTTLKGITSTPQIGIIGTFNSSRKINPARADYDRSNQISSTNNLLMRIVGDDGEVL